MLNTREISSKGINEYFIHPIERDLDRKQITIKFDNKSIDINHYRMLRAYIKQKIAPTDKYIYCLSSTENKENKYKKELVTMNEDVFIVNTFI